MSEYKDAVRIKQLEEQFTKFSTDIDSTAADLSSADVEFTATLRAVLQEFDVPQSIASLRASWMVTQMLEAELLNCSIQRREAARNLKALGAKVDDSMLTLQTAGVNSKAATIFARLENAIRQIDNLQREIVDDEERTR